MKKSKNVKLTLIMLSLIVFFTGFVSVFGIDNKDNIKVSENSENVINIAMALDEGYLYPTVVSMISMLENKDKDSVYHYYIMHPAEFSEKSKMILRSTGEKYPNCVVNLIDMENKYNGARQGHVTTPAYYRLSLSDLLPNEDKILWLDGDTLIFKDLKEMFSVDMTGYCYKGFLDYPHHLRELENFGIKSKNYICDGVMVINLKELRKHNAVKRYEDFITENNDRLSAHDQTAVNVVFHDKIGVLPAKYCLFNFHTEQEAMEYPKRLQSKQKYSENEMKNAFNNPHLFHYVKFKPWRGHKCRNGLINGIEVWWKYAEKSKFFNEIKDKYAIKDGIYVIESVLDNNKILGVDFNNINKSSLNVKLIDKSKNGNQVFKVKYNKDGCYEIQSLETEKLLNVSGAKKENATNIDEYKKNGTDAQKWFIFKKDQGKYVIASKCNQKCVDVCSSANEAGTNIQCWEFNNTDAQKFKFRKIA